MGIQKYFILIFLFMVCDLSAQTKLRRTNQFKNYKDHLNEIEYGVNLSYLRYENDFAPQLHLHYSRYLSNYFSVGIGYGGIHDAHLHNTISLDLSIKVYKQLVVSLKPGIVTKSINGDLIFLYSMGFETNYEFKLAEFLHIGPLIEVAIIQDDFNVLGGLLMGFTF